MLTVLLGHLALVFNLYNYSPVLSEEMQIIQRDANTFIPDQSLGLTSSFTSVYELRTSYQVSTNGIS